MGSNEGAANNDPKDAALLTHLNFELRRSRQHRVIYEADTGMRESITARERSCSPLFS